MTSTYKSLKKRWEAYDDEQQQRLDGSNDIHLAMALASLIYTLGEMRTIARRQKLKADLDLKEGKDRAIYQFLAGDYGFIDAFGEKTKQQVFLDAFGVDLPPQSVPYREIGSSVIEDTILDPRFLQFNEKFASLFTVKSFEVLKRISKNQKLFINTFDAVHNELELVYAITVLQRPHNEGSLSQVCVVFRGSVEMNDWMHNGLITFVTIDIKIVRQDDTAFLLMGNTGEEVQIDIDLAEALQKQLGDEKIQVHSGFVKYLFAKQNRNHLTKYEAITNNLILLNDVPMFSDNLEWTTTGHSLGGAMASFLAFLLACDDGIQGRLGGSNGRKWIKCISFASPQVGNGSFCDAFEFLRLCDAFKPHPQKELLKHLRITNDRDLVPLLPPLPGYRHTGDHVHLRGPNASADIGPSKDSSSVLSFGLLLLRTIPIVYAPVYLLFRAFCFSAIVRFAVALGLAGKFILNKIQDVPRRRYLKERVIPALASLVILHLVGTLVPPSFRVEYKWGLLLESIRLHINDYSPSASKLIQVTAEHVDATASAMGEILERLDAIVVPFIMCLQVIMLINRPQDIYRGRKEGDDNIGITHSLPFYNFNLDQSLKSSNAAFSTADEVRKVVGTTCRGATECTPLIQARV